MILFTQVIGVGIEAWKVSLLICRSTLRLTSSPAELFPQITKAVDISLAPSGPGSVMPFKLVITDKHVLSEEERQTQV